MDNEEIQNTIRLPDEIVVYSISQFLDGDDTMNLSRAFFSDIGHRNASPSIYWRKIRTNPKSISISQCFYLKPEKWMMELQYNSVLARNLISFDASHCFWLPVKVLLETLSRMPNLEKLLINDTQISLAHLPRIFKSCPKLNKLSFSLAEENLDKYTKLEMGEEAFGWLLKGFKRLTHLKLFTFNLSDEDICRPPWPVTFGVLGWCSSRCIDLHIEISYPPAYSADEYPSMGEKHAWISSLKSLVVIARGSITGDIFVHKFLKRFARRQEPNSFQRLWIERQSGPIVETLEFYNDDVPLTKSLVLWRDEEANLTNDYPGLRQLEHVANINFSSLANYPGLRYIRGYCIDAKGLNNFCVEHPMLEQLHFSTADELNERAADKIIRVGHWTLPHLKTLVYRCSFPVKEIIAHLIVGCPKLEKLHIGKLEYVAADRSSLPMTNFHSANFLSAIEFSELKSLSFDGFQLFGGSYMASILQQCPKLQSLYLSGTVQAEGFLRELGECLPKATQLRDLRIQLFNREEETVVLDFLKKLRGCSIHLKRLVLYTEVPCDFTGPTAAAEFRNLLTLLPLDLKRLVLICLAGIRLNSDDIAVVEGYWAEKILPDRPGFGHFFGPDLPKGNYPTFPRIHMDEIVRPIDCFLAPPHFDDISIQENDD